MARKTVRDVYTRKQFITDCVKSYIRNNPEEYEAFKKQTDNRRFAMFDSEHGRFKTVVNGRTKADEDNIRLTMSIPSKLMNAMRTVVEAGDNEPLFEAKGEMTWFKKSFPGFVLTSKI